VIKTKVYLYGNEDRMFELGHKLKLSEKALEQFNFCCFEVFLDIEVDENTGEAWATHFEGVELKAKVKVA
jgi:hypothetical protein